MLGNIIGVDESIVLIKLNIDLSKISNLINLMVIMESEEKRIIGEIINIKDNIAYVNLLGELKGEKFVYGVINKPSFSSTVKLISKERIPMIISTENFIENEHLYLGTSPIYEGVKINVEVNKLFSNHFAIFGSTGSGKSCSVARIFQNLFSKPNSIPYRSSIFIFDAYGEYHTAFEKLNEVVPEINFKYYTTNVDEDIDKVLRIPLWLLDVDDIALLLECDKTSQLPIIEKALKLVTVFAREESQVIKHKNDIIARAILDILTSGKNASQIRDQIISVLSYYNTSELNLDTQIFQPGYTRPLKQCLLIDASGKIRDMELIMNFMQKFTDDTLELNLPDGSFKYTLEDLKDALDFALISEGILKSEKIFDEYNVLKVRLHSLVSGNYSEYFNYDHFITKEQYVRELLSAPNDRKAQIINFNINYIDDRFAKTLTKIYSRLLFNYAKELKDRASIPFHIILEEAHRYVQNDNDVNLLGYNIFDRITKEGRKYGVLLGLISQRPSELSDTSISQCSNFLIFNILHPLDLQYIKQMVPNITEETSKKFKTLQAGNCVAFGNAFKVPVFIKFEMPNPAPSSSSCDIRKTWFIEKR
ncbi:MAG: ATP-binding protein [Bacilli bacterium]